MAAITKTAPQPPSTIAIPPCNKLSEKTIAAEAIGLLDPVYVSAATDTVTSISKANGTAATAPARVVGIAIRAAASGEPVTVAWNFVAQYGTGLTPGSYVYLGTVAGGLDTAATTGGPNPLGLVVSPTRIQFFSTR